MGTTSLGLTYPESGGHTRIWEHIETLADQVDTLLVESRTWTSYTPVWTAATSNPAIGNGSIVGRYLRWGDLVYASGLITMGSTTTYGTGEWRITLPTAAASLGYGGGGAAVDASSSGNNEGLGVNLFSSTQMRFVCSAGNVSSLLPFSPWQAADTVNWTTVYEAA